MSMTRTDGGPVRRPRAQGVRTPRIGRFIHVEGRRVHLHMQGRGAPVLLLHGNGGLGEEVLAPFAGRRGVAWISPDRPGYGFSAAAEGHEDPVAQALWAARLLDALGLPAVHVVAHSIASGLALCLAAASPGRVLSLTLLTPFCRPTTPQWKLGLRLAVAPVVGPLLRPVVPYLLAMRRERLLARMAAPNPPPATLRRLPVRHLARPRSLLTLAAELNAFNAGMTRADPRLPATVPVVALLAADDRTADPEWHWPWLRDRVAQLDLRTHAGIGHMLHHVRPDLAWQAVRDAMAREGGPASLRAQGRDAIGPGAVPDAAG
jgi:pimeloyl-ACP methyl ester carboxylesterase